MARRYKNPALTVDIIVEHDDQVLLIKRKNPPFKGKWALPGGFVDYGETVEEASSRELAEETGIVSDLKKEDIFSVYSAPDRDPRGHTVSVVFRCKNKEGHPLAGDDADEARFFYLDELPELAFDHGEIIRDYISSRSTE